MLDNIESSSTDVEIELETISNETPSVELPELAAGSNNNLHNHNSKETVHIYVNDCVCDDNKEDETETETDDHYNEETETESEAEDLLEAEAGSSRRVSAPYFIQWQSPIVEWLSPIRDWQVATVYIVYLPLLTPCCQAPLIEYQENLLGWYVPYCQDWADGAGLGEEDIFQP